MALEEEAVEAIDRAVELLDDAEAALLTEERLHTAPSVSNQNLIGLYAEITPQLEKLRVRLTGLPRVVVP